MQITPGIIVVFYQNRLLQFGLVASCEAGRCQIICETGEDTTLNAARLILIGSEKRVVVDAGTTLSQFRKEVSELLICYQDSYFSFLDGEEMLLADIALKLGVTTDAKLFSLYIYLKDNPARFNHRKEQFSLKSAEERAVYLAKQAQSEARQAYLAEVNAFINGGDVSHSTMHLLYKDLPNLLQDVDKKDLLRLIINACPQISKEEAVACIRIKCGELPEYIDPAIIASGIPVGFSPLVAAEPPLPCPQIELTDEVFTIDDEDTLDYDDAISLHKHGEGWKLGIHVSNVASRLDINGLLWQEARERVSSLYTANTVISMFPEALSNKEFSLIAGCSRPVISLYVSIAKNNEITDYHFVCQSVKVNTNFSYRQMDRQLGSEPYSTLKRLAAVLKAKRGVESRTDKPRFYSYVKEINGDLLMKRIDTESPSRKLVEELMILFNSTLAQYSVQNGMPMVFRNITRYGEEDEQFPPSMAYLSTSAEFHPGIGSSAYLHATSPIRRFTDLLNHVQFVAKLQNLPVPYSVEKLKSEIEYIEKRLFLIRETTHRSERYWILRYIEANCLNTPVEARLRGYSPSGIRVEIMEWGLQVHAMCDSIPKEDSFIIVFNQVDWHNWAVKADVL